jgi:hypothetical protein
MQVPRVQVRGNALGSASRFWNHRAQVAVLAFAVPSASRGHTYQCYPIQFGFTQWEERYTVYAYSAVIVDFSRETNANEGKTLKAETITTYSESIPAELGFGFKLHCVRMQLYRWRFRRIPIS